MPRPIDEKNSRPATSSQHRNQLLWTGAVAVLLGIVALQHASSPVSSTIVLAGPETAMTGIPVLETLDPSELVGYPVNPPSQQDAPSRLSRVPSSSDHAAKP